MPGGRIWRLLAGPAVTILVVGCGGGGGSSTESSCRSAEELASPDGAGDDRSPATRALLGMASSFRGAPDLAANIAPAATPGYQSLTTGQKGSWQVAALQLADRPRTLEVDFRDGDDVVRMDVPPGTGACVFEVTRRFTEPANRREVSFTLTGSSPGPGLSFTAYVDVVPKR